MNSLYFSAEFAASSSDLRQCPPSAGEVAFAGRSNAGKSSAINTLTRNGKLARTSKTPGRTQLINHFRLRDDLFLVDLPGYGYAQVSRSRQQAWQITMSDYLANRDCLRGLVLIMDMRHPLTDNDWQLIALQQQGGSELHVVLTKSDKVSRNQRQRILRQTQLALEAGGVEATLQGFSALKKEGIDDLHSVLDHWLLGVALPEEAS